MRIAKPDLQPQWMAAAQLYARLVAAEHDGGGPQAPAA